MSSSSCFTSWLRSNWLNSRRCIRHHTCEHSNLNFEHHILCQCMSAYPHTASLMQTARIVTWFKLLSPAPLLLASCRTPMRSNISFLRAFLRMHSKLHICFLGGHGQTAWSVSHRLAQVAYLDLILVSFGQTITSISVQPCMLTKTTNTFNQPHE
jgi:hypothetical protein